jgi:tripartite-type tricarboxylate transporter receptor subunit TctC
LSFVLLYRVLLDERVAVKQVFLNRRRILSAAACLPAAAMANSYPQKPIRLIVPFGAGGITDLVARVTAEQLGSQLNQSVVVENRPGAGGNIAAAALAQAAADGYTLMFSTLALLTVNPHLYEKLPFDPFSSFTFLSTVTSTPHVITVSAETKANTLAELVAIARKEQEGVRFGTAGIGSSPHQGLEIFQRAANVKFLHIPYKSGAESVTALLSGAIDMTFEALPIVMQHVKPGKLKALALAAKSRHASVPSIPTTQEAGFPSIVSGSTNGLVGPAGLPAEVQTRLKQALSEISTRPGFKGRLFAHGSTVIESTGAEFAALVRSEHERWGQIFKPGAK